MSRFGEAHDRLAKANSQKFMRDVHPEARKKNRRRTNKFKVSRHPLPMGYGFDLV